MYIWPLYGLSLFCFVMSDDSAETAYKCWECLLLIMYLHLFSRVKAGGMCLNRAVVHRDRCFLRVAFQSVGKTQLKAICINISERENSVSHFGIPLSGDPASTWVVQDDSWLPLWFPSRTPASSTLLVRAACRGWSWTPGGMSYISCVLLAVWEVPGLNNMLPIIEQSISDK